MPKTKEEVCVLCERESCNCKPSPGQVRAKALLLNLRVKSHDQFETHDCTEEQMWDFLRATGEVFEHRPFIAPQSSNPATVYRQNKVHYETL